MGDDSNSYAKENRARIIEVEQKLGDIRVEVGMAAAEIRGFKAQLGQHMIDNKTQNDSLRGVITDLTVSVQQRRMVEEIERGVDEEKRTDIEWLEAQTETANAKMVATTAQTIKSIASPEGLRFIVLLITLVGGLTGQALMAPGANAAVLVQLQAMEARQIELAQKDDTDPQP